MNKTVLIFILIIPAFVSSTQKSCLKKDGAESRGLRVSFTEIVKEKPELIYTTECIMEAEWYTIYQLTQTDHSTSPPTESSQVSFAFRKKDHTNPLTACLIQKAWKRKDGPFIEDAQKIITDIKAQGGDPSELLPILENAFTLFILREHCRTYPEARMQTTLQGIRNRTDVRPILLELGLTHIADSALGNAYLHYLINQGDA